MVVCCLDWWVLVIMVLLAGLGPDAELQVGEGGRGDAGGDHGAAGRTGTGRRAAGGGTERGGCRWREGRGTQHCPPPHQKPRQCSPPPFSQVAAMGLLFNAFVFIFYTTEGYGTAASTRVSNGALLGAVR